MDELKKLLEQLQKVRQQTEKICAPLAVEDYLLQAMPDVSPMKWHLAHTTWFFETFLLVPFLKNYQLFNRHYPYLYNSYYESLGAYHARDKRGVISRPTVEETYRYRHAVDQVLPELINKITDEMRASILFRLELGIHHEQQHQELMLMDIKYNFAQNPLRPAYINTSLGSARGARALNINARAPRALPGEGAFSQNAQPNDNLLIFEGGMHQIGSNDPHFSFDNERPQHTLYLEPFKINRHLVSNGQYLEFISAGGYQKPEYWLSDGWLRVQKEKWQTPLYWEKIDGEWWVMTLFGMQPLDLNEPVCHVSFYEADAFARWAKARLPTEMEWEVAAQQFSLEGNFLESGHFHPLSIGGDDSGQFFGDVWEWTQSPYVPYPGFVPFEAPLSEYNGKFACNQYVLRGGCALTPQSHMRVTYRNFYYPYQRWPLTGIRLGGDV